MTDPRAGSITHQVSLLPVTARTSRSETDLCYRLKHSSSSGEGGRVSNRDLWQWVSEIQKSPPKGRLGRSRACFRLLSPFFGEINALSLVRLGAKSQGLLNGGAGRWQIFDNEDEFNRLSGEEKDRWEGLQSPWAWVSYTPYPGPRSDGPPRFAISSKIYATHRTIRDVETTLARALKDSLHRPQDEDLPSNMVESALDILALRLMESGTLQVPTASVRPGDDETVPKKGVEWLMSETLNRLESQYGLPKFNTQVLDVNTARAAYAYMDYIKESSDASAGTGS